MNLPQQNGQPRKPYQKRKADHEPLLVSVNNAASILGIGRTKMLELIRAEAVHSVKLGKSTMVTMDSLRHVAKHGVDPELLNQPQPESEAA